MSKPITIEELRELKPSLENPVKLECFDDFYTGACKTIEIVFIGRDFFVFNTSLEVEASYPVNNLKHYILSKPEPRTEILYECINNIGVSEWLNSKGLVFVFHSSNFYSKSDMQSLKRKTGREAVLNLDTFEIMEVR